MDKSVDLSLSTEYVQILSFVNPKIQTGKKGGISYNKHRFPGHTVVIIHVPIERFHAGKFGEGLVSSGLFQCLFYFHLSLQDLM